MKVVCAGQIKTGTKSITRALRILGLNVYDLDEQLFDFADHWVDVFQNGTAPDVKRVYEKADAAVDMPGAFFFEEILEAFPDCKVILSIRDEESWIKSVVNQLKVVESSNNRLVALLYHLTPTVKKLKSVYKSYINAFVGSDNLRSTYVFKKRFRIHNARVKSVVPPEKLLVYNIKQGWKPLCDFLGFEIPTMKFPHENIGGELVDKIMTESRMGQQINREFQHRLLLLSSVLIILAGIIVFLAFKFA